MKDFAFITGNQRKVDQLKLWLGLSVEHQKIELDEIQSLDPHAVVEHKVRQAYALLKRPVLVEDVALTFTAMGRLPGTLVKWFIEEIGVEGLCKIADGLKHREAVASICYAWFDGQKVHFFEHNISGVIPPEPRGSREFGWNAIFQPEGATKTYGEMTDDEKRPYSMRAGAIDKLKAFLIEP